MTLLSHQVAILLKQKSSLSYLEFHIWGQISGNFDNKFSFSNFLVNSIHSVMTLSPKATPSVLFSKCFHGFYARCILRPLRKTRRSIAFTSSFVRALILTKKVKV